MSEARGKGEFESEFPHWDFRGARLYAGNIVFPRRCEMINLIRLGALSRELYKLTRVSDDISNGVREIDT